MPTVKTSINREIAGRRARFFAELDRMGLDGALVSGREDAHYLSGYTGSDAVLLFAVNRRRCWLATDARYAEEAERSAPGFETVLWKNGFAAFVGKLCKRRGLARIGYCPASLTVSFHGTLRRETGGRTRWKDIGPVLSEMRAVKSKAEIAAIEKSLACAEAAFATARKRWRIGMTEREVKDDLEWEMRRRGGIDAFETIAATGANASLPHAHSGLRKLAAGKMLLVDFGARVGFYNSDLTRTLWPGYVPKVWLGRYRTLLEAQREAIGTIAAGVAGLFPEAIAREFLTAFGIDESHFIHSLGHGVGLAVHEGPRLGKLAAKPLAAGNIVTVEPGVYFPGSGGIRIEDMALVEKDGVRLLSSLPKDVDSIIL